MRSQPKNGLLMVSNFLSGSLATRGVCEDLAERLSEAGWAVTTTSTKVNRLARLFDMLSVATRRQRDYSVAQVDVFSGSAFIWAELVCRKLRRLGKAYALTLHGGSLPQFAKRWPSRARKLLRS